MMSIRARLLNAGPVVNGERRTFAAIYEASVIAGCVSSVASLTVVVLVLRGDLPVTALEPTAWTSFSVLVTISAILICLAVTFRGHRRLPPLARQARVRFVVLLSTAVVVGAATAGIRGIVPSDVWSMGDIGTDGSTFWYYGRDHMRHRATALDFDMQARIMRSVPLLVLVVANTFSVLFWVSDRLAPGTVGRILFLPWRVARERRSDPDRRLDSYAPDEWRP